MVITMVVEKIIEEIFYPCYYKLCKEKHNKKVREIRTRKAVKNIFKFIYMIFSCIAGWCTLKDSSILPPSLGGNGSLYNTFEDFPFVKLPELYKLYFTGSLGYHMGELLGHILSQDKHSDSIEIMFHHLLISYLYVFSYFTNQLIGGVIIYLHTFADIFICLTRILAESEFKKTACVTFIIAILIWFHTRIYVFP